MKFNNLFKQDKVTRQELSEAISNEDSPHFLLDVYMRVGKSMIAATIINNKSWEGNILILSGAEATNKQWIQNLTEYNPHLLDRADIYCYQSLHKLDRDKYSIILLDEADLAFSDKRWLQIQEFKPEHWIMMSGTLDRDHIMEFRQLTNNQFFHAKVSLEQGVSWGILPQPKVFAVKLSMDNTKRYLVYVNSRDKKKKNVIVPFNERWTVFKDKKVNALIQCTEVEYYGLLNEKFEKWKGLENEWSMYDNYQTELLRWQENVKTNSTLVKPQPPELSSLFEFIKDKFPKTACLDKKMRIGNERKKFFADIKNRWFKKLFAELPQGNRSLVFCNDTAQADLLNAEFAVHSNNPGSIELVEQFNKGEIDKIFSCKLLDRGQDFFGVEYLIIIQSSLKQGSQAQRAARSLLSLAPKIIVMYYPDTQDEKYVQEFLKQFKPEWIVHKTL